MRFQIKDKLILYYLCFNLVLVLVHFCLLSLFSFFHFLLGHELGIIEDWLIKNSWFVLFIDKLVAFVVVTYFLQFKFDYRKILKNALREKVNIKFFAFSFFILVSFYALIEQFGGGINKNNLKENLVMSTYIFSGGFYLFDFLFLFLLNEQIKFNRYSKILLNTLMFFLIYKITERIILPEVKAFEVIYFVHFITFFIFVLKKEFYSIVGYAYFVVAPMTAFWGIDIVWDNAYSLYAYDSEIPVVGILGLWMIAFMYLFSDKLTKANNRSHNLAKSK